MSYRVLARAYRSNTFDEVVGQETLATTLKNAITSGRVHHGYLFTGTRGVGKTSMARILAKALNCLEFDAPTITPCCKCDSCRAVAVGEDIDVVEIDAASNTGVDDIRVLRTNATLRPARARFKIYIIDEVHMLSTNAFNALLKTLEEPPSHVKFILATTESQKVPATIQSRCQRFDFRAIGMDPIVKHLEQILKSEKIEFEDGVLRRVARMANGSMRDALSLLDQLLSYDASRLTKAVVDEVIPPPHDELAFSVVTCLAEQNAAGALAALDKGLQSGRTVERFCDHLIEHLRTLMLLCVCGEKTDLVDVASGMRKQLVEQATGFDAPTYVYMIALLEELRRNVKSSGAARALADAAVVRLAMAQQFSDVRAMLDQLESEGDAPSQAIPGPSKKKRSVENRPVETTKREVATTPPARPTEQARPATPEQERPALESTTKVGSTEWDRVAGHPFVMKIKEAVDGTLTDVRRIVTSGETESPDASDESKQSAGTETGAE